MDPLGGQPHGKWGYLVSGMVRFASSNLCERLKCLQPTDRVTFITSCQQTENCIQMVGINGGLN